jgi:hypothetical protein
MLPSLWICGSCSFNSYQYNETQFNTIYLSNFKLSNECKVGLENSNDTDLFKGLTINDTTKYALSFGGANVNMTKCQDVTSGFNEIMGFMEKTKIKKIAINPESEQSTKEIETIVGIIEKLQDANIQVDILIPAGPQGVRNATLHKEFPQGTFFSDIPQRLKRKPNLLYPMCMMMGNNEISTYEQCVDKTFEKAKETWSNFTMKDLGIVYNIGPTEVNKNNTNLLKSNKKISELGAQSYWYMKDKKQELDDIIGNATTTISSTVSATSTTTSIAVTNTPVTVTVTVTQTMNIATPVPILAF